MENINFLKEKITEIANLKLDLEKKGGPSKKGNIFEKTLTLEDLILEKFGLPNNPRYNKILSFSEIPTEIEVSNRIGILSSEAEKYLYQDAKSNIEILSDAQKLKQDWSYVLPEIKVTTHHYTIFVYNHILLEHKDSIENILSDLLFVESEFIILDTIGRLEVGLIKDVNNSIKYLKEIGVRYVDEYIKEFSIITRWEK